MTKHPYIYFYARHPYDDELCRLEMRAFFNEDSETNALISNRLIAPSRSVFIKGRLDVLFEADDFESFLQQIQQFHVEEETFKVTSLNQTQLYSTPKMELDERRKLERQVGLCIDAEPDLNNAKVQFYFVTIDSRWYFGQYTESKSVALKHKKKPHSYSTALSTSVARTVCNIAAPNPENLQLIDPCCGIGNVLVEALSMDFNIVGSDFNPLVVEHTLENIAYFGYKCDVTTKPIADVTGQYDVAIIDMPYNIFSRASAEEQYAILVEARRIAKKAVIVSIETIDDILDEVGFKIVDRCEAKKSNFIRQILVCE